MKKMIGTCPRSRAALVAALALAILPACDGGDDPPNTPPVTPEPALVRTLLAEGSFDLDGRAEASGRGRPGGDYIRHQFTTSGTARIEVNAEWTFANSQMGIVVGRGACSLDQIDATLAGNAAACPEAGRSVATSKPAVVNIGILPQNTYTLVILNLNDHTESGNYQVYQEALSR